jgi:hypothetical protein
MYANVLVAIRRQGKVSLKHRSLPEQRKHKTNINQSRKTCLRITAVSRSVFKSKFYVSDWRKSDLY